MAVAPVRTEKPPRRNARSTYALTTAQDTLLGALADAKFDGNRSAAIGHLIDVNAGKELERALLEQERVADPVEIVRWKSSRLSAELAGYVAGLIRAGNVMETACDMAGITPAQRRSWTKKGRNDMRDGKQSIHADFVAALARAEAECEAQDIRRLREHGNTNWQAIAWRLERQNPQRYAQRKVIDGKMQHSLVPLIDYDRLSAPKLRMLVQLLREASPDREDATLTRNARPAIETVPEDVLEIADADWTEAPALEAPALEAGPPAAEAPGLETEKPQG